MVLLSDVTLTLLLTSYTQGQWPIALRCFPEAMGGVLLPPYRPPWRQYHGSLTGLGCLGNNPFGEGSWLALRGSIILVSFAS